MKSHPQNFFTVAIQRTRSMPTAIHHRNRHHELNPVKHFLSSFFLFISQSQYILFSEYITCIPNSLVYVKEKVEFIYIHIVAVKINRIFKMT